MTGSEGMKVTVALRPEKISVARKMPDDEFNRAQGTVKELSYFGSFTVYHLELASGARLKVSQANTVAPPRRHHHLGRHGLGALVAFGAGRPHAVKPVMRTLKSLVSSRVPVIGVPYAYLLLFFLLPFLIVFKISVSEMEIVAVKDLLSLQDGVLQLSLKFSNYLFIWEDALYVSTYLSSLKYAAATTLLCLLIGYPFAYFMARARPSAQPGLLMLVMLPFWTSFLLRVYAWKGLLSENGWIADLLIGTGARPGPVRARTDPGARQADEHAVLARAGHDLHLPALHDPAAVRQPGQDGPAPARGGGRPGGLALGRVLEDHGAACPRPASSPVRCWCSFPASAST